MRLRLLASLTHVLALEADYWLTGPSDGLGEKKENIYRGPVLKQLKVCAIFYSITVAIGVSF